MENIGTSQSWEELDNPRWIKAGPGDDDLYGGVEEFFRYLYRALARGR